MSTFMKLKLEKSTTQIAGELSADEVFGKMIAAEVKQLLGNVKPLARRKINGVIFKYQMPSNQSTVLQLPRVSFTHKRFSTPSTNARPTGSCEAYQTGYLFNNVKCKQQMSLVMNNSLTRN